MIRRGVILPVVLLTLLLLGLLCAMFAFRVNADLSATQAIAYRLQTRLAAETGIDRVKMLLRADRMCMDRWYHNPDELHRIIVWAYDVDRSVWGTNEELDEGWMAYRFSIVADDPLDDEDRIRIGITDEASKLNLNYATEAQLMILVRAVVANDEEIDPGEIVAAILDWRDEDQVSQSEAGDTEGTYYLELDDPYPVKNGPFDTVEELLLVKGVTGAILYGEDFDRNGLLTENEDDGDDSFPPDDQDNVLNRGLYPFLTVHSYENNVSNDNRQRTYLLGEEALVRAELDRVFEDDPGIVDYIVSAARGSSEPAGAGDESGGGDDAGGEGGDGSTDIPDDGGGDAGPAGDGSADSGDGVDDPKADSRRQHRDGGDEGNEEGDGGDESTGELDEAGEAGDGGETDDAGAASGPIRTPAELLRPRVVDGVVQSSPVGSEHLPVLMDCTTVEPPATKEIPGLINVNTAPGLVLRCIEGLTGEQIREIVEIRGSLSGEDKATTAWLVVEDVLDLDTYIAIAPKITARGQQFTVESLGYGDHVGTVTRLQAVVDLVGPIAQTVYCRDLTSIGGRFPIREEDEEFVRER